MKRYKNTCKPKPSVFTGLGPGAFSWDRSVFVLRFNKRFTKRYQFSTQEYLGGIGFTIRKPLYLIHRNTAFNTKMEMCGYRRKVEAYYYVGPCHHRDDGISCLLSFGDITLNRAEMVEDVIQSLIFLDNCRLVRVTDENWCYARARAWGSKISREFAIVRDPLEHFDSEEEAAKCDWLYKDYVDPRLLQDHQLKAVYDLIHKFSLYEANFWDAGFKEK